MELRSNGKLMLTGEYMVLRGAEALTLPLRKGQTMKVTTGKGVPSVNWKTTINGCHWFDARFSIPDLAIANTNDFPTAQNVRELLLAIKKIKAIFPFRERFLSCGEQSRIQYRLGAWKQFITDQ